MVRTYKNMKSRAIPQIVGCLLLLNSISVVSAENVSREFLVEFRNYCTEYQSKLDKFSVEVMVATGQFQILNIKSSPAVFVFDKTRWQGFSHPEAKQRLFTIECGIVPAGKFMAFELLDADFKQPLAKLDLSGVTIW